MNRKEVYGRCHYYIATIRLGVSGDYLRLTAHAKLADALGIEPYDERLTKILHNLDLPVEPTYAGDPREKTFFTHPDRNLSDIEVVEKYAKILCDKLIDIFDGDDKI